MKLALSLGVALAAFGARVPATNIGAGWTCSNHRSYVACRHGASLPSVELTDRHAGNFTVDVTPAPGAVARPMLSYVNGDRSRPVWIFSSPLGP